MARPGLGAAESPREQPEPRGASRQLAGKVWCTGTCFAFHPKKENPVVGPCVLLIFTRTKPWSCFDDRTFS